MIAFWKDDPRAPPPPPALSQSKSDSSGDIPVLQWPRLFTQPIEESKKRKTAPTDGDRDSDGRRTNHKPVLNNEAVLLVDPVVEVLPTQPEAEGAGGGGDKKESRDRRRIVKRGVDLLEEEVFTYFEALNSGLVLSGKGICSLNCGGTCAMCKQFAAANANANADEKVIS
jgi:hypothetical protein